MYLKINKTLLFSVMLLSVALLGLYTGYLVGFRASEMAVVERNRLEDTYTPPLVKKDTKSEAFNLFILINSFREQEGLSLLSFNPYMCPFAEQRLRDIHTDWSHSGFEYMKTRTHPYPYVYAGENLAEGYNSPLETLNAWKKSPEHLKNIVSRNFTDTCIAVDEEFAVQEFASF